MERIGIPVFESRISPVLDSCNLMVMVDIDQGSEIRRREISLEKIDIAERIQVFARWRIGKIICAGVSDLMWKYIAAQNIALIGGVAGELEKILDAYIRNRLDDDCFVMPGRQTSTPDRSKP